MYLFQVHNPVCDTPGGGNKYMRRVMLKRIGSMGGGAMFGSMFAASQNSSSLKYYCMSRGTEHRQIACPKCGSKMKRVGS
jgi:hypothetical protein